MLIYQRKGDVNKLEDEYNSLQLYLLEECACRIWSFHPLCQMVLSASVRSQVPSHLGEPISGAVLVTKAVDSCVLASEHMVSVCRN